MMGHKPIMTSAKQTTRRPFEPCTKRSQTRPAKIIGANTERCFFCDGTDITRRGKRYKKHEIVQLWYCRTCNVVFTPQHTKGKTYPLKLILEGLIYYYRGHTASQTLRRLKDRFGLAIAPRTFETWLSEYKPLTTYARLRKEGREHFTPHKLIRSVRLHHQQVYHYRVHNGKLSLILNTKQHRDYAPIGAYLTEMATDCPHHLFQDGGRASKGKETFNLDAVEIKSKQTHAQRATNLVLQTVTNNYRRHDEVQRFMLTTDSVTVAVEVPILLTPEDITYMRDQLGFDIPIHTDTTLTGHIDVLQIRNGAVHILDYKPNAVKEKPISQLMVYALALSRRTGLRLYDFTCAWFDEDRYYEFYPLHVVHKINKGTRRRTGRRGD